MINQHGSGTYSKGQLEHLLALPPSQFRNTHTTCYKLELRLPVLLTLQSWNKVADFPLIQEFILLFLSHIYEYFSYIHRPANAISLVREEHDSLSGNGALIYISTCPFFKSQQLCGNAAWYSTVTIMIRNVSQRRCCTALPPGGQSTAPVKTQTTPSSVTDDDHYI